MKLESLTPQQEQKMYEVRDYWLNYIFSCKNSLNKEKARRGIEWLYKISKIERPMMVFVDSPMGCQLAAHVLKNIFSDSVRASVRASVSDSVRASVSASVSDSVMDSVSDSVRASVWDSVWASVSASVSDSVRASVSDSVWASVRASVSDSVRASVSDSVWASVWASVSDSVRASVSDSVRASVMDSEIKYEPTSFYGNTGDYGWVAFFDYFIQIGAVEKHENLDSFKHLLLSGIFDMIQLQGICIVSDMPTKIIRNDEGRLHSITNAAIEFKDGYCQHYIRGVCIPFYLWNRLQDKSYSFEDFIKEPNEEIKSAILAFMEERWGGEYLFRFISENLNEVNTYTDQKKEEYLIGTNSTNIGVYTLFKGEVNNIQLAFVRCWCYSTDRMFFLSVDPSNTNAKDAIASLYRVPNKLKTYIQSINRQGERMSTTFTDEGWEIFNSLSKEDLSDLTTISGNEYFSKMRYEY